MKIAILGATGHVSKNMIDNLRRHELYLFSRNQHRSYSDFFNHDYDAIINCIGFGDPVKIANAGVNLFLVTEEYDNKILEYLKNSPDTKYVFISSGVVHLPFDVNNISKQTFYQMPKINAEAKHRAMPDYNIVDIRLYSFFSRYTNLDAGFFMSALIKSIKEKTEFVTDYSTLIRDYINPKDLTSLAMHCLKKYKINGAYDSYSNSSVEKMEIINYFVNNYKLKVKFVDKATNFSSVGLNKYVSVNHDAAKLGYSPQYTSMETIKEESSYLI